VATPSPFWSKLGAVGLVVFVWLSSIYVLVFDRDVDRYARDQIANWCEISEPRSDYHRPSTLQG
jgi:hypothetical protein